jgi:hypothetical protein
VLAAKKEGALMAKTQPLQIAKIYICGATANNGPRGIVLNLIPLKASLEAAGLDPQSKLPTIVLTEDLAIKLVGAIPRHLAARTRLPRETIH